MSGSVYGCKLSQSSVKDELSHELLTHPHPGTFVEIRFESNPCSTTCPALFPFIFVTIACGAISGFHGLVSSGTTSKQISSIKDAKLIGYGSMLGEGTLA